MMAPWKGIWSARRSACIFSPILSPLASSEGLPQQQQFMMGISTRRSRSVGVSFRKTPTFTWPLCPVACLFPLPSPSYLSPQAAIVAHCKLSFISTSLRPYLRTQTPTPTPMPIPSPAPTAFFLLLLLLLLQLSTFVETTSCPSH